jgi:hypothetical protein
MSITSECLQLGEQISIPADWRRVIGPDCPIRRCPLDLDATLQRWQQTYGAHALLDLGLLQQDVDGVALNSALRVEHAWLQPHVDPDSEDVIGISTDGGLLTADGLSIARSLDIAVAHELRNEPAPRLFFTSDVHDLGVLSSFGYVARPIQFLSFDRWCELDELCEILGCRGMTEIETRFDVDDELLLGLTDQRQLDALDGELAGNSLSLSLADSDCHFSDDFSAIILGWSLAALTRELPAGFLAIIEDLKRLQTVLGWDISKMAVWWPDQATLDRLRFGLNRGTERDVRSILERSLRDDLWTLDGFVPWPIAPPSLLEAFSGIEQQAAADAVTWRRAADALRAAEQRELIVPMLQGVSDVDPLQRCLQMNSAMLQSMSTNLWCDVQRNMACGDHNTFSQKTISLLLATTDRLLRNFKAQDGGR